MIKISKTKKMGGKQQWTTQNYNEVKNIGQKHANKLPKHTKTSNNNKHNNKQTNKE